MEKDNMSTLPWPVVVLEPIDEACLAATSPS